MLQDHGQRRPIYLVLIFYDLAIHRRNKDRTRKRTVSEGIHFMLEKHIHHVLYSQTNYAVHMGVKISCAMTSSITHIICDCLICQLIAICYT